MAEITRRVKSKSSENELMVHLRIIRELKLHLQKAKEKLMYLKLENGKNFMKSFTMLTTRD
jgi:hypothetical protein